MYDIIIYLFYSLWCRWARASPDRTFLHICEIVDISIIELFQQLKISNFNLYISTTKVDKITQWYCRNLYHKRYVWATIFCGA